MRRAVVQTQTCGEADTTLETVLLDERPCTIFDVVCDLRHGHARTNELPGLRPDLAMDLRSTADIVVCFFRVLIGKLFVVSLLFRGCPV